MFVEIYNGKMMRIFERCFLFFWLFMDEWNDNFDAKITVFKWKKLTIGLHQIKSWITSPYFLAVRWRTI